MSLFNLEQSNSNQQNKHLTMANNNNNNYNNNNNNNNNNFNLNSNNTTCNFLNSSGLIANSTAIYGQNNQVRDKSLHAKTSTLNEDSLSNLSLAFQKYQTDSAEAANSSM